MLKKEVVGILLVFFILLYIPLTLGYIGNSSLYDVQVSSISFGGFENTTAPTISIHFEAKTTPIQNGSGGQYTVAPGLARPLGPVAFNISITAHDPTTNAIIPAHDDSIINCTGINAFAFMDMPKHYYRFTDTSATINTAWSTSGILNCSTAGCVEGENLTCYFKVDDSHMNSTEIQKTIPITYRPKINNLNLTPLTAYTDTVLSCNVDAADGDSDPMSYYYLYNDTASTLQGWSSTSTLDCGAVGGCDKHDNITCYAIVSDSYANSTMNFTNTVEILNSPPTLTGVTSNTSNVKYGDSINITGYGTGDVDGDNYRLECGNQSGLSDLCISGYGTGDRWCGFSAPWNDTSSHTVYCRLYDSENVSAQRTVLIGTDNSYPIVALLTPTSGTAWNQSISIIFEYNVTDNGNINLCNLVINGSNVDTSVSPQKDTTLNFTYPVNYGSYVWRVDCTDNTSNTGSSQTWNFSQSILESLTINNMGVTGFEQINPDYTHTRAVINTLTFAPSSDFCRFRTVNASPGWTEWKQCSSVFEWILPENDANYTVLAQINHTGLDAGVTTNLSDWIYLQKSGVDLDITPPEAFTIYDDGNYSNKNTSFHAKWDTPKDVETLILRKTLTYKYIIIDNTTSNNITGWISTNSTEITETGLSLVETNTYIIKVNATNPAGYTAQSVSDGIIIDLTNPSMSGIDANPDTTSWTNTGNLFFNWSASDSLSGVFAYSMILDNSNDTSADDLEENNIKNRTYTSKGENNYYFHIKPKDAAGNWGQTMHYGPVKIDKTSPTRPIPSNPTIFGTGGVVTFAWSTSTDSLSGMKWYNFTIHNLDTGTNFTNTTAQTSYNYTTILGNNYYITIIAVDNANNTQSSELPQTQPVSILSARPNQTTVNEDPIIKVTTSKKSECTQNITNKKFLFTDSTYHETKLFQSNGAYSLKITCEDADEYSDSVIISYTVDKAAGMPAPVVGTVNSTYTGKVASIPITVGTYGGLSKDRFKLYLNNSFYTDFTLIDEDDSGSYTMQFIAKNPGQFSVIIDVDGQNSTSKNITINKLILNIDYSGISSPQNKSHLTYADFNNKKVGLGSDANTVNIQSNTTTLKLNASSEGKTYIFFTRKDVNVEKKNTDLKTRIFDQKTASFGYSWESKNRVNTRLDYKAITILGPIQLQKGVYTLFLQNLGQDENNQTIIRIELE